MRNVKKFFKKFIILGISVAMLFLITACNTNRDFANYKSAKKTEIQNYANEKGEDGAYFIINISWEKYVRNCAKNFGIYQFTPNADFYTAKYLTAINLKEEKFL